MQREYGVANCGSCGEEFQRTGVRHKLCQDCGPVRRAETNRVRSAAWRVSHRDEANASRRARIDPAANRAKSKAWALANPERFTEQNRQKYLRSPDKFKSRAKQWSKENPLRRRQIANTSAKLRRQKNPEHFAELKRRLREKPGQKLHQSISNRIQMSLGPKKAGRSWQVLVGYTLDQLRLHLERQFADGMTWQNRGLGHGKWHIDHILPVSSFKFEAPEDLEFKACWALSNLRPLWSVDNIRKSANRTHLL